MDGKITIAGLSENLDERSTIHFPRPVELGELRTLFNTVAEAVPCKFSYTTKLAESIGNRDFESENRTPNECYVKSLCGTVINGLRSADFQCEPDIDYDHQQGPLTKFNTMRFMITPGYDSIEELAGRVCDDIGTMDRVREHIKRYFVSRQTGE